MEKQKFKVSVVTVCFNSARTIRDTMESVLSQSEYILEYIVIDGGSTDNTINIIKDYKEKFQIKGSILKFISEPDEGIYYAMNKGVKMASGEIIGILNSDDWYEPNAISIIVNSLKEDDDILHGNLKLYSENEKFLSISKPQLKYQNLWKGMILKHPTIFIKKSIYEKYGYFNTSYKIAADYDLILRFYLNECNIRYVNENITCMRLGGVSNKFKKLSWHEMDLISKSQGGKMFTRKYNYILRSVKVKIKDIFYYLKGGFYNENTH